MLPNSTQIPNFILDELLPVLKPTELTLLLIIIRQTLGWIEDVATGRRKEKDWMSSSQLVAKTGYRRKAISGAIQALSDRGLIVVTDGHGKHLCSAKERRGKLKLFYRFNTSGCPVSKRHKSENSLPPTCIKTTQELVSKGHITKETHTKETCERDFTWESFVETLHNSDKRYLNIIGYFFEKKRMNFDSYEKAEVALKRHLKASKLLEPFSDKEITRTIKHLQATFPPFTLETVVKHLTR
jgi:biotin operon repressor